MTEENKEEEEINLEKMQTPNKLVETKEQMIEIKKKEEVKENME